MKSLTLSGTLCALGASCCTSAAAVKSDVSPPFQISKNGQSTCIIALAADAIPAEKTAAWQLKNYLQQITGGQFEIRSEAVVKPSAPQILVGIGRRAKTLLPKQNWAALGNDGIVVKSVGNKLVLAGGRPRGSLYAVFQFLEDTVGCRWWTETESTIPKIANLSVTSQNLVYVPPFTYREHLTTSVITDPIFATVMRENGHHQRQRPAWGGHHSILGFVHTFSHSKLLPVEKYFKDHPEWYSDPANGFLPCTSASHMPEPQETEPCLSNPEVLAEVTKNALKWISENPDAGYISISQNDNGAGYCRDAESLKLIEEEGSPSAPLIKFVNAVAAKVHEKYPDFLVETLAYNWSENPPKTIRPAKNVIVRLAPASSDFSRPFDSDANSVTRSKVRTWSKISSQLFIWNYVTNFHQTMMPHPNWDGLAKDLRFFAANNVTGIFQQGDAYTNGVGDFVQLRTWLIGKLMWNPQLDQSKLIEEFTQGYYGPAAPFLRRYLQTVKNAFLAQNRPLSMYNKDLSYLDLATVNACVQLFDQAEAAVKTNPALLKRVQRDRLGFELARLFRFKALQHEATLQHKTLLGNPDPLQSMQQFIARVRGFGVKKIQEGSPPFEEQVPQFLAMFAPPVELPEFFKAFPATDVIDLQPETYQLFKPGEVSFLEADKAAAGKQVASVNGDSRAWAIQAPFKLTGIGASPEKWHVYVYVRAESKPGTELVGDGLQIGIYDNEKLAAVTTQTVAADKIVGDNYQRIDLGIHPITQAAFLWIAPAGNPALTKVFCERVILVRAQP